MRQAMLVFVMFLLAMAVANATTYYVDCNGNDSANGTSTASAWLTIEKVNDQTFSAGDSILFNRGCTWRGAVDEYLDFSANGTLGNDITYSAYGTGNNPSFLGSQNFSNSSHWVEFDTNIWKTNKSWNNLTPNNVSNPNMDTNSNGYLTYFSGGEASKNHTSAEFVSSPHSLLLNITGTNPDSIWNSQLYFRPVYLKDKTPYRFSFWIKSNKSIELHNYQVIERYSTNNFLDSGTDLNLTVNSTWQEVIIYFITNEDFNISNETRIGISFGQHVNANNSLIYMDDFEIVEISKEQLLYHQTGNIILNGESAVGTYKKNYTSLASQGDFYSNTSSWNVFMYSTQNPGTQYTDIELALGEKLIAKSHINNINISNIDLRYCAKGALEFNYMTNIFVSYMNVRFVGGAELSTGLRTGNGVQFGLNVTNATLTRSNITEVMDACTSAQAWVSAREHNKIDNVEISYNILSNCDYGWEYFNTNTSSETYNISVHHNTFYNMGKGLIEDSKPTGGTDNKAYAILLTNTPPNSRDYEVLNNIFFVSENYTVGVGRAGSDQWKGEPVYFDYNLYYQNNTRDPIWKYNYSDEYFTLAHVQGNTSNETNGDEANPLIIDAENDNFIPKWNSPACAMSSSGSYVGALACQAKPTLNQIKTDSIEAMSETINLMPTVFIVIILFMVVVVFGVIGAWMFYNKSIELPESTFTVIVYFALIFLIASVILIAAAIGISNFID